MRVIVVDETGVRFHGKIMKDEPVEEYCSCAKKTLPRKIDFENNKVFITLSNREYVAVILRKDGSNKTPLRQHNLEGVSIYTTKKFMVWVRFAHSYQEALHQLRKMPTMDNEDKYIISAEQIDKISLEKPSDIFVYESSFGDVFSVENYSGETVSGSQQMQTNLKRSSYSNLLSSYPECWT